jgi:hypothetical protein
MGTMQMNFRNAHSVEEMRVQRNREPQDERHEPPFLLLDEDGLIRDCSKSVEARFGYRLNDIVWQHVSCLFPQFSEAVLIQKGQINPNVEYIAHCGHVFQGLGRRGGTIPTELKFIRLEHDGVVTLRLILHPPTDEDQN